MVPQRKLAKDLSVFPTVALRKLGGVCVAGGGGGGLNERFISFILRRFHNLKREALGVIDLR